MAEIITGHDPDRGTLVPPRPRIFAGPPGLAGFQLAYRAVRLVSRYGRPVST